MPRPVATTTTAPFAKLVDLGDTLVGAFAGSAQRPATYQGVPSLKADGSQRSEEIAWFIAMPGCSAKLGNADSGFEVVAPEMPVRYAISGFQWSQVIEGRKHLPAAHGLAAGKIGSSDVYTFTLTSYSAATDNPEAARKAGFTVVEKRIVMRTPDERDKYVLARSRNGQSTGVGKDLTVAVRRVDLPDEQRWADLADELYRTKPWERSSASGGGDYADDFGGGAGGSASGPIDEEPFLRDAQVGDL